MKALTDKQQSTLNFIQSYIKENKMSPTMLEIANGMGWSSPNAAQSHVDALKRKGWVKIRRGVSRGLSLVGCVDIDIPQGWMLVPIEPTEDMVIRGFESAPYEVLSDAEAWEAYEAMSGCQQAAHKAKLCWAAMLAAVPEVGK